MLQEVKLLGQDYKMDKKVLIFTFAIFLLVFTMAFISAEFDCCPLTKTGKWCVDDVPQDQCARNVVSMTCATYTPCKQGVCVEEDGDCSSGVRKTECESKGDSWFDKLKEQVVVNGINVCQKGCCFYGDSSSLLSYAECKSLATSSGLDIDFREGITDESTCIGLSNLNDEVACMSPDGGLFRDCRRMTRGDCQEMDWTPSRTGLLCTAPELYTDCAKSENTVCYKEKVYFTDTCGNRANIYNEFLFEGSEESSDYWTYIKEPSQSCQLDSSEPSPLRAGQIGRYSSTCGNCDEIQGTICSSYKNAEKNIEANQGLQPPEYGDKVCASLDCAYDTNGNGDIDGNEIYQHGESWCAETEGTVWHINITNETGQFQEDDKTRDLLTSFKIGNPTFKEAYNNYNVPGSRYAKLTCIDGEVDVKQCDDLREQVCMESVMGVENPDFKIASCVKNTWRNCFEISNQTKCDDGLFCRWVPGYRFDDQKLTSATDRNIEYQGSCIPLFSPGLQFWYTGDDETIKAQNQLCSNTTFVDGSTYEVSEVRERDELKERPVCVVEGTGKNFDPTTSCIGNCYLVPSYGKKGPEKTDLYFTPYVMQTVHKGDKLDKNFENYCISDRKQYYCQIPGAAIFLEVGGHDADCAKDENDRKEFPLYFTHEEFMNSIKDRSRSIGDCGYKQGLLMENKEGLSKNLESVWSMFMKLDGDGSEKKTYEIEKVYQGDFETVWGSGYHGQ